LSIADCQLPILLIASAYEKWQSKIGNWQFKMV